MKKAKHAHPLSRNVEKFHIVLLPTPTTDAIDLAHSDLEDLTNAMLNSKDRVKQGELVQLS